MAQIPSRKAKSPSASQKVPAYYETRKFIAAHDPDTCPCSEPNKSSPRPSVLRIEDLF